MALTINVTEGLDISLPWKRSGRIKPGDSAIGAEKPWSFPINSF